MHFVNDVRSEKVSQPVHRSFSLEKWKSAFDSSEKKEDDVKLYDAGVFFYYMLKNIREKIGELYPKGSEITREDSITIFCATSNRERDVLLKASTEKISSMAVDNAVNMSNAHSVVLDNNPAKNNLTINEISIGSIDGIQVALSHRVSSSLSSGEKISESDFLQKLELLKAESTLSQLYNVMSDYWAAVLWGECEFLRSSSGVVIRQKDTAESISKLVCSIRKDKLYSQLIMFGLQDRRFKPEVRYLTESGSGKKRRLIVKKVDSADDIIKYDTIGFLQAKENLKNYFPEKMLSDPVLPGSLSVTECLQVFRLLSSICRGVSGYYPEDSEVMTYGKMKSYVKSFNVNRLAEAVTKSSGIKLNKALRIINFLCFDNKKRRDIWCYPLVKINSNKVILLDVPLLDSVLLRVVENWFSDAGVDQENKGYRFEEFVVTQIVEALRSNKVKPSYDVSTISNYKVGGRSEEIDILFRLGSQIVVGELKCIVCVDNSSSYFRTLKRLKHGAEQARRKCDFIQNNAREIFSGLGWVYSDDYQFSPLVVSSNQVGLGFDLFDVPVVDQKILVNYLKSDFFPLFSVGVGDDVTHKAHLSLYKNSQEMEGNIEKYFKSPPQLNYGVSDFKYVDVDYKDILGFDFKYERLVSKELSVEEHLSKNYGFTVIRD